MQLQPAVDFFDVLVRYETYLWNELDAQLRASGHVALPTLTALRVVRRHVGSCRVQELRTDLGITVGAASKMVDRLERTGLAVRTAHPTDRRSTLVVLTEAGDAAHDAGVVLIEQVLAEHMNGDPTLTQTTAVLSRQLSRLSPPTPEVSR